jgi:hypothetical protein
VSSGLPNVFFWTFGKEASLPSFKKKHCRVFFFDTGQIFLTLGKEVLCRVLFFYTRQRSSLPSVFFALGKHKFQSTF